MNKKTLAVLILMGISLSSWAQEENEALQSAQLEGQQLNNEKTRRELAAMDRKEKAEEAARQKALLDEQNKTFNNGNVYADCRAAKESKNANAQLKLKECATLYDFSGGEQHFAAVDVKGSEIKSMDGAITCRQVDSFTIDYKPCEEAVTAYNVVLAADKALDLTQEVRTFQNDQKLQKETAKQVAQGESQGAVLDAAAKNNEFHKRVQQEKVVAYSGAVAALVYAYQNIPVIDDAKKRCKNDEACMKTVDTYKGRIIANKNAKGALVRAITVYTGKGIAAGIAMKNHDTAAQTLNKAKQAYVEEDSDLMMERCMFNPTDPLCIQPGNRVATSSYTGGGFTLGGDGLGNAFNLNPETVAPVEMGEETNLEGQTVASVNSPFVDEAKEANEIMNPAGAAQMQPGSGGSAGGGGGGGGGGMGGGSASLGGDLAGAEAESNKEAQIKANKISGNYSSSGGGGFRGAAGSKEKANPFASLFDNKAAGGGIEEDKVAADIDGAASGLFQKISNRYVKIQADKRIEASNLE